MFCRILARVNLVGAKGHVHRLPSETYFDKRDRNYMSRTVKTLKFKMRWFPDEGHY